MWVNCRVGSLPLELHGDPPDPQEAGAHAVNARGMAHHRRVDVVPETLLGQDDLAPGAGPGLGPGLGLDLCPRPRPGPGPAGLGLGPDADLCRLCKQRQIKNIRHLDELLNSRMFKLSV